MNRVRAGSLAERIAGATPDERDRVVDALRVGSLLVVVLGHWLMAGVVVAGGRVNVSNALASMPALQPATWVLQVMPLFFMAGGFANLTVWRRIQRRGDGCRGYSAYLRERVKRLVWPALVFAALAQSALGVAWWLGVADEYVALAGRALGGPLWFLVVYLLVTAAAPAMARWHERAPLAALLVPAIAAAVLDVVRMAYGAHGLAYGNYLLVWLVVQQLGFWYADGRLARLPAAALTAVVGGVVAVLVGLTAAGPYPVSMIGLPGEMSNMSPPSVCLLLLALVQAAMITLLRPHLDRWLRRPAVWASVVPLGARAMTIYLWHIAVLVLVAGLALIWGINLPPAGSTSWWVTRPVWLVVLAAVLVAVVVPVSRLERWRLPYGAPRRRDDETVATTVATTVALYTGLVLVVTGLLGYTLTGLEPFGVTGTFVLGAHVQPALSSLCVLVGWLLATRAPSGRWRPGGRLAELRSLDVS